ncbi:unnamed protein product [Clonostachys solani]|uniref:Uncharacterized protein n=1 Tax=Clonostachys solani TaxID=160281 RepID=A0A9N9YXN8_9HYPO|nr:unnamed protein product [Clonostachys solani]
MDQFLLKDKVAVVTGGCRGLGFAFAEALAGAGASIAILDVGSPDQALEELRNKYSAKFEFYHTNVTDREQVENTVQRIEKDFGSVDININAAGVVTDESFLTSSDKNLSTTFDVNFKGSFLVAQACANAMFRKLGPSGKPAAGQETSNGCIVFIASVATHIGTAVQNISVYTASKAAVRGLVKPMAMELAQYGIRVNSLSPGPMQTAMYAKVAEENPGFAHQMNKETMFGRAGYPEELKGCVLFLCSQASSWYTGQDLLVDGGASSWKHLAA